MVGSMHRWRSGPHQYGLEAKRACESSGKGRIAEGAASFSWSCSWTSGLIPGGCRGNTSSCGAPDVCLSLAVERMERGVNFPGPSCIIRSANIPFQWKAIVDLLRHIWRYHGEHSVPLSFFPEKENSRNHSWCDWRCRPALSPQNCRASLVLPCIPCSERPLRWQNIFRSMPMAFAGASVCRMRRHGCCTMLS